MDKISKEPLKRQRANYQSGDIYGKLTLTGKCYMDDKHIRHVEVICSCGTIKFVWYQHLKSGNIKSCGCFLRENGLELTKILGWHKHNLSWHPLHTVWLSMIDRCYRKKNKSNKHYVDVTVCPEWLNGFKPFYDWAINNGWEEGLQLDKDKLAPNQTGLYYSPEFCCFITSKENGRNRSITKMVIYNNEKKSLGEWCEILNLSYRTIIARLHNYNWSIEKAFETPIGTKYRNSLCL